MNIKNLLKTIFVVAGIIPAVSLSAQEGLEKYRQEQKAALSKYAQEKRTELKNYRDSINREYAKYLEESWKSFDLQQQERRFEPMSAPPVYEPEKPQPSETPKPVNVTPVKPVPPTEKPKPEVKPKPEIKPKPEVKPIPATPEYPVAAEFFGTAVRLQTFQTKPYRMSGISEKEVAGYWRFLSGLPCGKLTDDMLRIKKELKLNDWAMYMLANSLFKTFFPNGSENEQVVFSMFIFNQLGYRAKIGRTDGELLALIAFKNKLSNTSFFTFEQNGKDVKYSVLNPNHRELSSLQTCGSEYGNDGKLADVNITQIPDFNSEIDVKQITYQNRGYNFEYSRNLVDFYATYPCVDFSVYADAPLDEPVLKSLQTELKPQIEGKSQEEAVNFILHFVQNAFEYKNDDAQFGYEKWNFAEETLVSSFSDCDDRAVFFTQLVKNLLGMKAVLVYYPKRHLAAAVKFDSPDTQGDYVTLDGVKYLICDPTYRNANLGKAMPKLRNIAFEIIRLK
ncbi:MAG: hypothetical protein LBG92_05095 [Prevotellaceae bacterium]|jgi:hypothetical protein|nr:hypothetical protein [Prevotellaceae bacterium]